MAKVLKAFRDYIRKTVWENKDLKPRGLYDLSEYMRHYKVIRFNYSRNEDGSLTAVSENFRHGSIITSGRNEEELDKNIKDAILTSFEIPSSYAQEAKIIKEGADAKEYALA